MGLLSFANLAYLENQYDCYQKGPQVVDLSWRYFFEGWDLAQTLPLSSDSTREMRGYALIDAYRAHGYLKAQVNPLKTDELEKVEVLLPSYYGLEERDLDKQVDTAGLLPQTKASLREIQAVLEKTYCNFIGIQYKGLEMPGLEKWLQETIEPNFPLPFSIEEKKEIFQSLSQAEFFEIFMHKKFVGQKRFSLEGGESLIPMLRFLFELAAEEGVTEVVFGMTHRGRLNVLGNLLNKPFSSIFHEFKNGPLPSSKKRGDVKYHKGFEGYFLSKKGKKVGVILSANPSHLESVDPVVEGLVRAKQEDQSRKLILPLLIHGDASIAGQGVVYETLQLGRLAGYQTGGTIHLVINNQIGFTTLPSEGRSTRYCTDIGIPFRAPIFHLNGDRPEESVYAMMLALRIRQQFECDVFLELNCYRKHGHNEGDEPLFTHPIEYQAIMNKRSVRELYQEQLIKDGIYDLAAVKKIEVEFLATLEKSFEEPFASVYPDVSSDDSKKNNFEINPLAIPLPRLIELAKFFCTVPESFNLHPKIKKLIGRRLEMIEGDPLLLSVDWGMAEHLAYATLLSEGIPIRISGQDSCRGTFSHRHAIWVDQKERGFLYSPLSHLDNPKKNGKFEIINSPLSEFAVLGFEFGYSLAHTQTLVIWEAQFGDFSNEAQVIIDQYIASGEQKWGCRSGITLFLPHGYEGQGPEHSSARIERFLQLSADDNWQVISCTTPAQFFHILRQQMLKKQLKPLIIFTPKELLRHPQCLSAPNDFSKGRFEGIIDDSIEKPQIVLLCSGKIYYDLLSEKKESRMALVRIEQLYPFPMAAFQHLVEKYQGAEWRWVQEEPSNMGAWGYLSPILESIVKKKVRYVGRKSASSTAAGFFSVHRQEQQQIIEEAYRVEKI